MQIRIIPVTSFEQNCSLLCCPTTGKAALVDPGGDPDRILAAVRDAEVSLQKIFVTHGHFDHVGAVAQLAEALALPIEGPQEADRFLLDSLPEWCRQFGFPPARHSYPTAGWSTATPWSSASSACRCAIVPDIRRAT